MSQELHDQTLAYRPIEFMRLGAEIATWAADPEIFASFPKIIKDEGRYYFYTSFGYCPNDSGVYGAFAYDDLNKEFCYWCGEDPDWDWEVDEFVNLNNIEPQRFDNLIALKHFLLTGEQPEDDE